MDAGPSRRPTGAGVGRLRDADDAAARYLAHLQQAVPTPLAGLHVVVDCAHGAAATVAPELYRRAGAKVSAIAAEPDGLNINDGVGSTHLSVLVEAVRAHGADLESRTTAMPTGAWPSTRPVRSSTGPDPRAVRGRAARPGGARPRHRRRDGHEQPGFPSRDARRRHHGDHDRGRRSLRARGAAREGPDLGGEQSGHVVFTDAATTGDGLLTALHVMARMAQTGARWRSSPGSCAGCRRH